MFWELVLDCLFLKPLTIRKQLVPLNRYAVPLVQRSKIASQKAENVIAESRNFTFRVEPLILTTTGPFGPGTSILRTYRSETARILPCLSFLNALGMYVQKSRLLLPRSFAACEAGRLGLRSMSACAARASARFFNSAAVSEDGRGAR